MIKINNVPCGYQKEFDDHNIAFILLHKLIEKGKYQEYYLNPKNTFNFIILDNSAFELGTSLNEKILIKWAYILQKTHPNTPIEIIIPDSYKNYEKTIELMNSFFKNKIEGFYLMGVPQGKNKKELFQCLKRMLNDKRISTIGLNKLWSEKIFKKAAKMICKKKKEIHKLGLNNMTEWSLYENINIRSADSRRICQLVLGVEDIWDCDLNREQIKIIERLIEEF